MNSKKVKKRIRIKDIQSGLVISRPEKMYAWPGICRTAGRDILVAASERRQHVCPYGREVIFRSTDGGRTWSPPQVVYDSELDDRDANLLALPDGSIVLSWFTSNVFEKYWPEQAAGITEKMRREQLGTWFAVSRDNGFTWTEKKSIPVGLHISPVELSDGSFISIGIENRFGKNCPPNTSLEVYKAKSLNDCWYKTASINSIIRNNNDDVAANLNENHVLEIADGNLVALFRSERGGNTEGYLYQSFSKDYGCSWTPPVKTDIWGYPPHLLRLNNGVIMCSYSYRRNPYSIRVVFSYDNGLTWDTDNTHTVYEWEDEPDMGYPSSIELNPGKILMVFYCSRRDENHQRENHKMNSPEGILTATFTLEYK